MDIMDSVKDLEENLLKYIDLINPYVKINKKTHRFYIDLINRDNINISETGFHAMRNLVDRANELIDDGKLIWKSDELEVEPSATFEDIFRLASPQGVP